MAGQPRGVPQLYWPIFNLKMFFFLNKSTTTEILSHTENSCIHIVTWVQVLLAKKYFKYQSYYAE